MPTPAVITTDEDTKRQLETEAARQGLSPGEYTRQLMAGRQSRGLRTWTPPVAGHLPPFQREPPKTLEETMEQMMSRFMTMSMMRSFPSMFSGQDAGGNQLTPERVREMITEGVRAALPTKPENKWMELAEGMLMMKQMGKMLGDDGAGNVTPQVQAELERVRAKFDEVQRDVMSKLGLKDQEIEQHRERERQAALDARFTQMNGEVNNAIAQLNASIANLRPQPGLTQPPQDAVDTALAMLDRLQGLKGKLDTLTGGGQTKPWWVDEIKSFINVAADNATKVLEGIGSVEAGKRGLPPPGRMPEGVPGSQSVLQPEYASTPGGSPPPGGSADPWPQLAGFEAVPNDPNTWPNVQYTHTAPTGETVNLSRDEFVRLYGQHIYTQRRSAGVLPSQRAPPPAPSPAPAAPPVSSPSPSTSTPAAATSAPMPPAKPMPPSAWLASMSGGTAPVPLGDSNAQAAPAPPAPSAPPVPAAAPLPPPNPPPLAPAPVRIPAHVVDPSASPEDSSVTVDEEGNVVEGGSGSVRP